jgi:hypothetical protein
MRRFGLLLAFLATPTLAQTAADRVFRLAELAPSAPSLEITRAKTLPELAKLGFREGRNLIRNTPASPPRWSAWRASSS